MSSVEAATWNVLRGRWFLGLIVAAVTLSGCKSYTERVAEYRQAYGRGDMTAACEAIGEILEDEADKDEARDALLVLLEAASTFRTAGYIQQSQQTFARAERIYDYWQQMARFSISREGISLLTNPATLPYRGAGSDILMLNTYQALNELQCGNIADARQPLMRLDTHQKEVVAANAEEIAKFREAEKKSSDHASISKTTGNEATQKASQALLQSLPDTRGYDLYVNPFSEYLFAFYHLHAGVDAADRETARFRMQRAHSLAPENTAIRQDAERLAAGAQTPPSVYIFHENGMAPYREEFSITLPIYAAHTFSWVSIALPKLEVDANHPSFAMLSGGNQRAKAELVCDMEAIVAKEYENAYPATLTRAIASATAKAVAAYAANYAAEQSGNAFLQLGTLIGTLAYQLGTATADTRSWLSQPKHFGVGRIDLPADRKVTVIQDGFTVKTLQIPNEGDIWVIYLRTMHRGSTPSVNLFRIR